MIEKFQLFSLNVTLFFDKHQMLDTHFIESLFKLIHSWQIGIVILSIDYELMLLPNSLVRSHKKVLWKTPPMEDWSDFKNFLRPLFVFWLVARKPLGDFRTNVGTSLNKKKELSRSSRVKKTFGYFGLTPTAEKDRKTEIRKLKK